MSVTIEVQIPDAQIPLLDQRARGAGLDRERYVRSIVSRDLTGPRRLDDNLGAFRHQVSESGMSDAELVQLFEAARENSESRSECELQVRNKTKLSTRIDGFNRGMTAHTD